MNIFFFGQNGLLGYLSSNFLEVDPLTINSPSGGGSHQITVTSNVSWEAGILPAWISITGGDEGTGNGRTSFTTSFNNTGSSRSGAINYTGDGGLTASVSVNQSFTNFLNVSPSQFGIDFQGATSQQISVTSSVSWNTFVEYGQGGGWITITGGGSGTGNSTTIFSVDSNPFANDRTASINYSGGGQNASVNITQFGTPDIF